MKKDAVDISTVFVDARDGNNSRPYCVIVKTPNKVPNGWPKFDRVWRVRAASMEDAEAVRKFLKQKRASFKNLDSYIELVEELQRSSKRMAEERRAAAYKARQQATPSDTEPYVAS